MRRLIVTTTLLTLHLLLRAQHKITFIVSTLPANTQPTEHIYLAGSFNNWNPRDEKMALQTVQNKTGITIDLPGGTIEYKFTRGGWDRVETTASGKQIQNRRLNVENDTTIKVEIQNWADHVLKEEKQSTATSNVHIMDSSFYMPQLDRHRRIWIYLPSGYNNSKKKYPVLYMQDGQNIFDAATSFAGEWGVDEAMDSLEKETGGCIVVGIDNGGEKRLNEYNPYDMGEHGKGEGNQYTDFIVHTLKPYVDQHFRTKRSKEHTFIAGSSMGGLISFYAILKYPNVFGSAGVLSPAFWIAPNIYRDIDKRGKKVKGKIYFYAGGNESKTMVPDMLSVFNKMHQLSPAKIETVIRAEGEHSEANWRTEFPNFIRWLMAKPDHAPGP